MDSRRLDDKAEYFEVVNTFGLMITLSYLAGLVSLNLAMGLKL